MRQAKQCTHEAQTPRPAGWIAHRTGRQAYTPYTSECSITFSRAELHRRLAENGSKWVEGKLEAESLEGRGAAEEADKVLGRENVDEVCGVHRIAKSRDGECIEGGGERAREAREVKGSRKGNKLYVK